MRTSGGRGADAWMLAIPVLALLVAGSMSAGGLDAVLLTLEGAVRIPPDEIPARLDDLPRGSPIVLACG